MAYPRRPATFRLTEQTHELLEILVERTGLDKTAMVERLIRAEAVLASRTDASLSAVLVKLPVEYGVKITYRKAGRKVKRVPIPAPDVPPPPPAKTAAAGLPHW